MALTWLLSATRRSREVIILLAVVLLVVLAIIEFLGRPPEASPSTPTTPT